MTSNDPLIHIYLAIDIGRCKQNMAQMATPDMTNLQPRVQEAHNLSVPKAPRHVTTLARFAALRALSLSGLAGLKPIEVRLSRCKRRRLSSLQSAGSHLSRGVYSGCMICERARPGKAGTPGRPSLSSHIDLGRALAFMDAVALLLINVSAKVGI